MPEIIGKLIARLNVKSKAKLARVYRNVVIEKIRIPATKKYKCWLRFSPVKFHSMGSFFNNVFKLNTKFQWKKFN